MTLAIYSLVGTKYTDGGQQRLAALKAGAPLMLFREPENPHDPNAVRVYDSTGRAPLGFVKGTEVVKLARLLDTRGIKSIPGTLRFSADRWPLIEVQE